MTISYYESQSKKLEKPIFSILIPTWNNLPFVQLCVRSIQQNSVLSCQIILHINDGSDGTLEWAKQQGLDFTFSAENIGICYACNAAFGLAKADYIVYMNDDMYACPNWDTALYQAIKNYGKDDFYLSGTMIEREATQWQIVSAPHDFGDTVENFKEKELLNALPQLTIFDWNGANFPPSVMHRRFWQLIGGFSVEFSPGMYSDPDICMKLWQAGVRHFRGVGDSLVYHFMSKSIGRVKRNNGKKQFLRKWGITPSLFFKYYLHLHPKNIHFREVLGEPEQTIYFKFQKIIAKMRSHL